MRKNNLKIRKQFGNNSNPKSENEFLGIWKKPAVAEIKTQTSLFSRQIPLRLDQNDIHCHGLHVTSGKDKIANGSISKKHVD